MHHSECDLDAEATAHVAAEDFAAEFDISDAPLLRLSIRHTPSHTDLIWTMHHLITDGWSFELLARDFEALYVAHREGTTPSPWHAPSLAALVAATGRADQNGELENLVADLESTVATSLGVSPPLAANPMKTARQLHVAADETSAILKAARNERVTVGAVLLHVAGAALSRVVGCPDISFGLITSGRNLDVATVDNAIAPLAASPQQRGSPKPPLTSALHQIRRAVALESIDIDTALKRRASLTESGLHE